MSSNGRSNLGAQLASAAAELIGSPFRLHGRDPRTGIDCVGLVGCALKSVGVSPIVPTGYRLRNTSIDQFMPTVQASNLEHASGSLQSGDILLVRPGAGQHHLLICETPTSFIHAHAGLRKTSRLIGALPWQPVERWRLTKEI